MLDLPDTRMTAGIEQPDMCKLELSLHNPDEKFFYLFFTLTEMWMLYHCKSPWFMTSQKGRNKNDLVIGFSDPKEAMFFKLTSHAHMTLKKQITGFINFLGF